MIDLERAEDEAYERLLGRILKGFGPEMVGRQKTARRCFCRTD